MDRPEDIIKIVIAVAIGLVQLVAWLMKERTKAPAPAPAPRKRVRPKKAPKPVQVPPRGVPARAAPFGAPRPAKAPDDARRKLLARLDRIERRAADLAADVRQERPNRRFEDTLANFVPREIGRLRGTVIRSESVRAGATADAINLVITEVETLARQRRDPELLPELGDADAFADACYAPVLAFARAEGLPLTSGYPATQIGEIDLAIWTGFIPTSIAPIFLPYDFFSNVLRWPAVAHEIGHDFLASVTGLEPALRQELGLPTAEVGGRPLAFGAGLDAAAIVRIFGAWFEEIFCDVFGTMMCGPAYVVTMIELFAEPREPRAILMVNPDPTGRRYDTHPPPHIRVIVGCTVLDRAGFHKDAQALWASWIDRHGGNEEALARVLLPAGVAYLALPLPFYAEIARQIVERLYSGPFRALSGFGLQGISGLDYGPHEHQQAQRASAALLAGRVPRIRDVRAVIAGAVLAYRERPDLEMTILAKARDAIPAIGTGETRPDAFDIAPAGAPADGALAADRQEVLEAIVLREILAPPRALRGRRPMRLGL